MDTSEKKYVILIDRELQNIKREFKEDQTQGKS